ncbi:hypothetical protein GETHLI_12250 [Geothrix limicola]|uniref:Uncharacterized protein n=1 Tax=Geothrix limicola TaxID=2927978 RepID=A0ABQ5QDS9_9BACT|nr:hypothetical protein [Geothrix limicola]GLH72723.1 hypothetical protein GETHLI_12250 [Geothrix limicola]
MSAHRPLSKTRIRAAWAVAITVDAIQLATAPVEAGGPPVWLMEGGVDLVTMGVLWALVGFHWAFLPSFLTKLLPFVDIAPTWTVAVFVATRGQGEAGPSLPPKILN